LSRRADRLYSWIEASAHLASSAFSVSRRQLANLERLAVGLGGAILASRAMTKLADGFSDLVDAAIVEASRALFHAAARERDSSSLSGQRTGGL
jgi:hypothetical protein